VALEVQIHRVHLGERGRHRGDESLENPANRLGMIDGEPTQRGHVGQLEREKAVVLVEAERVEGDVGRKPGQPVITGPRQKGRRQVAGIPCGGWRGDQHVPGLVIEVDERFGWNLERDAIDRDEDFGGVGPRAQRLEQGPSHQGRRELHDVTRQVQRECAPIECDTRGRGACGQEALQSDSQTETGEDMSIVLPSCDNIVGISSEHKSKEFMALIKMLYIVLDRLKAVNIPHPKVEIFGEKLNILWSNNDVYFILDYNDIEIRSLFIDDSEIKKMPEDENEKISFLVEIFKTGYSTVFKPDVFVLRKSLLKELKEALKKRFLKTHKELQNK